MNFMNLVFVESTKLTNISQLKFSEMIVVLYFSIWGIYLLFLLVYSKLVTNLLCLKWYVSY